MQDKNEKKTFNPWPVGLTVLLTGFITFQLAVVTMATTTFEGLDDVEYYKHGIEYGQEIARQRHQRELGWTISPKWVDNTLYLAVLDADQKPVQKATVRAVVGRPATPRDDHEVTLESVGPGIYSAPLKEQPGRWLVRLEVEKKEHLVKAEFRQSWGPS